MAKAKKLPSGNWRVNLFVDTDPVTGKRRYKSFTGPTKREAEYMAAEYKMGIQKRSASEITLQEAMQRYIESQNALSPSTLRTYISMSKLAFKGVERCRLCDLTQEMIQREMSVYGKSHSPKSVRNAHGFLSAVLRMFAPEIHLTTTLPQKEKKETYIPTEEEFKRLLAVVEGTDIEPAVLLAGVVSLRRSEIAALTDEDILDNGVRVNKALVRGSDNQWHLKVTKTASSTRIAPLPEQVVQKLRQYKMGALNPSVIDKHFRKAVAAAGLPPMRFHALRHYYASVLHAAGVPDKYIMQFGGWSTDSVLKSVYQHTMRDRTEKESERVTSVFDKMI
jgi:integrase